MEKFEKGKQYGLHYKSKSWDEWAGKIEITEIQYYDQPIEIHGNKIEDIAQIGEAIIKYVDTKYYKNKLFKVPIVGYFGTRDREKETNCLSLNNKFYFSVFLKGAN
jgi:hypothetical protein